MSEPADPQSLEPDAPSGEEQAWSQVVASWGDEAVHRAYLARFTDMDGFAAAGARYRAVLAERPEDATALRMREEVVKKASALALASLPRARRPQELRWARRLVLLVGILIGAFVLGFFVWLIREYLGAAS